MDSYLMYLVIASSTIASPGPGVVMTLTNSLKYGLKESIPGILGVSLGMLTIAIIVGGGLGIIIANSDVAFITLKFIGAAYLFYLGFKLIKNRNSEINIINDELRLDRKKSFLNGLGITLINPKPILFFIALFPQFIKSDHAYINQFLLLAFTFCFLIILIHGAYGIFAHVIKDKSGGRNYFMYVNMFGGLAYILFALSLILFTKNI